MKATAAVFCDIGRRRGNNEDNYYLCGRVREDVSVPSCSDALESDRTTALYAVCDGMGGIAQGEIASLVAVRSLCFAESGDLEAAADAGIRNASAAVFEKAQQLRCGKMGSTIAALFLDQDEALAANVGDSRVYLYRDGRLWQLSEDHDGAQLLVSCGRISPEEARTHPDRHKLTQYLGMDPSLPGLNPYLCELSPVQPDDVFLLCSDGLTNEVSDEQICVCLSEKSDPAQAAESLLAAALLAGGRDNVTAMVIRISNAEA